MSIPLPPALLQPNVSISYSSGAGHHSWIARGFQLSANIEIARPNNRARTRKYVDATGAPLPDVWEIRGGGLDGAVYSDGNGLHRWVGDRPGAVKIDTSGSTVYLTVDTIVTEFGAVPGIQGGMSTERFHSTSQSDSYGNRIDWKYTGTRIDSIEFGGVDSNSHVAVLSFSYSASLPDETGALIAVPDSYRGGSGIVEQIGERLTSIRVQHLGTGAAVQDDVFSFDLQMTGGMPVLHRVFRTVVDAAHNASDEVLASFSWSPDLGNTTDASQSPAEFSEYSDTQSHFALPEHKMGGTASNSSSVFPQVASRTGGATTVMDFSGDGIPDVMGHELLVHGGPSAFDEITSSSSVLPGFRLPYLEPYIVDGPDDVLNYVMADFWADFPVDSPEHLDASYTMRLTPCEQGYSVTQSLVTDVDSDGFPDLILGVADEAPELTSVPSDPPISELVDLLTESDVYEWTVCWGTHFGFGSCTSPATSDLVDAPFLGPRMAMTPAPQVDVTIEDPDDYGYRCNPQSSSDQRIENHGGPFVSTMDINGDGWVDLVGPTDQAGSGLSVYLHSGSKAGGWDLTPTFFPGPPALGSTFQSYVKFFKWSTNEDTSGTHPVHENLKRYLDTSRLETDLTDVNGDGLPDYVQADTAGSWTVYFNTGEGWLDNGVDWDSPVAGLSGSLEPIFEISFSGAGAPGLGSLSSVSFYENSTSIGPGYDPGGPLEFTGFDGTTDLKARPGVIYQQMLDMDGDGLRDLVVYPVSAGEDGATYEPWTRSLGSDLRLDVRTRWFRNTGSGFALEPILVAEWLHGPIREAIHRGSNTIVVTEMTDANADGVVDRLVYAPRTMDQQRFYRHADADTDDTVEFIYGFDPDSFDDACFPSLNSLDTGAAGETYSEVDLSAEFPDLAAFDTVCVRANTGYYPPPGLLETFADGVGTVTDLYFEPSGHISPAGQLDGSDPNELPQYWASDSVVVRSTSVDLFTGAGSTTVYERSHGLCTGWGCLGFQLTASTFSLNGEPQRTTTTTSSLHGTDLRPDNTSVSYDTNASAVLGGSENIQETYSSQYTYSTGVHPRLVERVQAINLDTPNPTVLRTEIEYDPLGFPERTYTSDVNGLSTEYDREVLIFRESDANGLVSRVTEYEVYGGAKNSTALFLAEKTLYRYDHQSQGVISGTHGALTQQTVCSGLSSVGICSETLDWFFAQSNRGALAQVSGPLGSYVDYPTFGFGGAVPTTSVDALGYMTVSVLDAAGRVTMVSDPNGVTSGTTYDSTGRVVETTRQSPTGTSYQDSEVRHVAASLDSANPHPGYVVSSTKDGLSVVSQTVTVFDGRGNGWMTYATAPENSGEWILNKQRHNFAGQVVSTAPTERVTVPPWAAFSNGAIPGNTQTESRTDYDGMGRPVRTWQHFHKRPNMFTTVNYGQGNVVQSIDPMGYQKFEHLNPMGQLEKVREYALPVSQGLEFSQLAQGSAHLTGLMSYDTQGRLVEFTDGNGNAWRTTWDGAGRRRLVERAPAITPGAFTPYRSFDYDGPYPVAMHELDATGSQTAVQWTYDGLGRMTDKVVTSPTGGAQVYNVVWDTRWVGARSTSSDPAGVTNYYYAGAPGEETYGYVRRTERTFNSRAGGPIVHRNDYDRLGRVVRARYPDEWTVDFTYGSGPAVLDAEIWRDSNVNGYRDSSEDGAFVGQYFDDFGLPSQWYTDVGPSGGVDRVDVQDRVSRVYMDYPVSKSHSEHSQIDYEYYENGYLASRSYDAQNLTAGGEYVHKYKYDELRRIRRVVEHDYRPTNVGPAIDDWYEFYQYDVAGNPVETRHLGKNPVASQWSPTPAFNEVPQFQDINGATNVLTWDSQSRLTSVSKPGRVDTYEYDGQGRLSVATSGAIMPSTGSAYLYDEDSVLLEEYDALQAETIYHFDNWREEHTSGGINAVLKLLPMLRVEKDAGQWEMVWALTEFGGNVFETVTCTQSIHTGASCVQRGLEVASAYGDPMTQHGDDWSIESLHGMERSDDLGIIRFGTRHALAGSGLWLQPEPLLALGLPMDRLATPTGFVGVYAVGNPINLHDRSGYVFNVIVGRTAKWVLKQAIGEAGEAAIEKGLQKAGDAICTGCGTGAVVAYTVLDAATGDIGSIKKIAKQTAEFVTKKSTRQVDDAAKALAKASPGQCFVAGSQVVTPIGGREIQGIAVGDRAIAHAATLEESELRSSDPDDWKSMDGEQDSNAPYVGAVPLARLCHSARALGHLAWIAGATVGCQPDATADVTSTNTNVRVYDEHTGEWPLGLVEDLELGDEVWSDNALFVMTLQGLEYLGQASVESLLLADATWHEESRSAHPTLTDWVVVLGSEAPRHRQVSQLSDGERFAFDGYVFETSTLNGRKAVRQTPDVIARVTNTFVRIADTVIDAQVEYADGHLDELTGTPNHPFWVHAARDYVQLGELEVGTVLHVQGGGEAILVSKTWRQGDFEVFDFEVEGLHNFYVRGEGSDAAGVLVHNSTGGTTRVGRWMNPKELDAMQSTGRVQTGPDSGGIHRVAVPADPDAYKAAPSGDVFVSYDVPSSSLRPHSQGTMAIDGPNSPAGRLAKKKGETPPELPEATNIEVGEVKP